MKGAKSKSSKSGDQGLPKKYSCNQIPEYHALVEFFSSHKLNENKDIILSPEDSIILHNLTANLIEQISDIKIKDPLIIYKLISLSFSILAKQNTFQKTATSTYDSQEDYETMDSYSRRSSTSYTYSQNSKEPDSYVEMSEKLVKAETKIQNLLVENHSLKNQMFQLQNSTCPNCDSIKSELEQLKTKYNDVHTNYNKLQKKTERLLKQNAELKQQSDNVLLKYAELQEESNKNKLLVENLKDENKKFINNALAKPTNTDKEVERYSEAIDQLYTQLKNQSDELNEDSKSRSSLITIINRLSSVNSTLENQLEKSQHKIKSLEETIAQQKEHIEENKPEIVQIEEKSTEKVFDITEVKIPDQLSTLSSIINDNSFDIAERISQVIAKAYEIGQSQNNNNNNPQTDIVEVLNRELCGLLRFVEHIANSKSVQIWLSSDQIEDDLRSILIETTARVSSFLSEHALGLYEDEALFDSLMLDANPEKFKESVSKLLQKMGTPKSDNEIEMFTALSQTLIANDVLRKFGIEARRQCIRQRDDIKNLKVDLERTNSEAQAAIEAIKLDARDAKIKCEEAIKAADERVAKAKKCIQKAAISENNSDDSALNEAIQLLDIDVEAAQAEANEKKALEEEIERLKQQLDQSRTEEALKKTELLEEADRLEQEASRAQIELHESLESFEAERSSLAESLAQKDDEIAALEERTQQLQSELAAANKSKEEMEQRHAMELETAANERATAELRAEEIAAKARHDVMVMDEAITRTQAEFEQQLQSEINKYKQKIAKLVARNRRTKDVAVESLKALNEEVAALRAQLENAQTSGQAATEAASRANEQLQSLKTEFAALQIECRMAQSKLSGIDDRNRRERTAAENQMKARAMALETDCQNRLKECDDKHRRAHKAFLGRVIGLFNDSSFEQPTDEAVIAVLTSIKSELSECRVNQSVYNNAKEELQKARQLLGWNRSLPELAADLLKTVDGRNDEVKKLRDELTTMKRQVSDARAIMQQGKANEEWENWARKLHVLVCDSFSVAKPAREVRLDLEEVVFTAIGRRVVWRRVESLRAQKMLLTSGLLNAGTQKPLLLAHVITVLRAVRRLQKQSGNVFSPLGLSRSEETAETQVNERPLFDSFIVRPFGQSV